MCLSDVGAVDIVLDYIRKTLIWNAIFKTVEKIAGAKKLNLRLKILLSVQIVVTRFRLVSQGMNIRW